ncbi:MAG: hypothetical protein PVG22_19730, partial [Chromatiales bacterium]
PPVQGVSSVSLELIKAEEACPTGVVVAGVAVCPCAVDANTPSPRIKPAIQRPTDTIDTSICKKLTILQTGILT